MGDSWQVGWPCGFMVGLLCAVLLWIVRVAWCWAVEEAAQRLRERERMR